MIEEASLVYVTRRLKAFMWTITLIKIIKNQEVYSDKSNNKSNKISTKIRYQQPNKIIYINTQRL